MAEPLPTSATDALEDTSSQAPSVATMSVSTSSSLSSSSSSSMSISATAVSGASSSSSFLSAPTYPPPPSPGPAPPPLPPGWYACTDKSSGKTYYYHHGSGQRSWERPPPAPPPPLPRPPQPPPPAPHHAATMVDRNEAPLDGAAAADNPSTPTDVTTDEPSVHSRAAASSASPVVGVAPWSPRGDGGGSGCLPPVLEEGESSPSSSASRAAPAAAVPRKMCAGCGEDVRRDGYSQNQYGRRSGTGRCLACVEAERKAAGGGAEVAKECVGCGVPKSQAAFSASQWRRRVGTGRCSDCTAAEEAERLNRINLRECGACRAEKAQVEFSAQQWKRRIGTGKCLSCAEAEDAERASVVNRKPCGFCRRDRSQREYSVTQWRRTVGTGKCLECVKGDELRRSEGGTKVCLNCGLARNHEEYSASQWRRRVGTGKCLACVEAEEVKKVKQVATKVCFSCGRARPQAEYSASQWRKTMGTGRCTSCTEAEDKIRAEHVTTKECISCSTSKEQAGYSTSQWRRRAGAGRCVACTEVKEAKRGHNVVMKVCTSCRKGNVQLEFSASQWRRPTGTSMCLKCTDANIRADTMTQRKCKICGRTKVQKEYTPIGTAVGSGKCLACIEGEGNARSADMSVRVCSFCGAAKTPTAFSVIEWTKKANERMCTTCLGHCPTSTADPQMGWLHASFSGIGKVGKRDDFANLAGAVGYGMVESYAGRPGHGAAHRKSDYCRPTFDASSAADAKGLAVSVAELALLDERSSDKEMRTLQRSWACAMENESVAAAQALLGTGESAVHRGDDNSFPHARGDSEVNTVWNQQVDMGTIRHNPPGSPDGNPHSPLPSSKARSSQLESRFSLRHIESDNQNLATDRSHMDMEPMYAGGPCPVIKLCLCCQTEKGSMNYTKTEWSKKAGSGRCRSCEDANSGSRQQSISSTPQKPQHDTFSTSSVSVAPVTPGPSVPTVEFFTGKLDMGGFCGKYDLVYYYSLSVDAVDQRKMKGTLELTSISDTTSGGGRATKLTGIVRMHHSLGSDIVPFGGNFSFETQAPGSFSRKRYYIKPHRFGIDGSLPMRVVEFPSRILKDEFDELGDPCLGCLKVVARRATCGWDHVDGSDTKKIRVASGFTVEEGDLWIHVDWTIVEKRPCESILIARRCDDERVRGTDEVISTEAIGTNAIS